MAKVAFTFYNDKTAISHTLYTGNDIVISGFDDENYQNGGAFKLSKEDILTIQNEIKLLVWKIDEKSSEPNDERSVAPEVK